MTTQPQPIENDTDFRKLRELWLNQLPANKAIRELSTCTLKALEAARYVYLWDWLGIPIIKMPEEILLIQELMHKFKPTAVVEIGVARGGGIALYHSMQKLTNIPPRVLGVDIKFYDHTLRDLEDLLSEGVQLLESSSTSSEARQKIQDFVKGHERVFVILDGDHSHENVLEELRMMNEILPKGSLLLCADTIISQVPQTVVKKKWDVSKNPKSALIEFMSEHSNWSYIDDFCNRVVLSESPGGWIRKN